MLYILTKSLHKWFGPFLLKQGINARCWLSRGGVVTHDNIWLDHLVGLQLAKRLVSLQLRDAADHAAFIKKEQLDVSGGRIQDDEDNSSGLFGFWKRVARRWVRATTQDTSTEKHHIDKDHNKTKEQTSNLINKPKHRLRTSEKYGKAAKSRSNKKLLYPDEEGKLRLQVVEKCLRPVLLPNETWADVQKWQFHKRLIQWIRREYLLAAHLASIRAAFAAYPELSTFPQLAPMNTAWYLSGTYPNTNKTSLPFDGKNTSSLSQGGSQQRKRKWSHQLPSTTFLQKAFGMQQWASEKDPDATYKTMSEIVKRIGHSTNMQKPTVLRLRGGALCLPVIDEPLAENVGVSTTSTPSTAVPTSTSLSHLSLGEILELVSGHVLPCGPLNVVCEERNLYQVWTQEYIAALGDYLLQSSNQHAKQHGDNGSTVILDVGAGDGLLAEALREYFQHPPPTSKKQKNQKQESTTSKATNIPTVVATDNGSWGISRKANVERMGYDRALSKYCGPHDISGANSEKNPLESYSTSSPQTQVILLCSWMPMEEDWSAEFRCYPAVTEYILIGECDDGQCGDNWETWGNPHMLSKLDEELEGHLSPSRVESGGNGTFDSNKNKTQSTTVINSDTPDSMMKESTSPPQPPFERDGYIRKTLDELQQYQFSRFDSRGSKTGTTVSFRRRLP